MSSRIRRFVGNPFVGRRSLALCSALAGLALATPTAPISAQDVPEPSLTEVLNDQSGALLATGPWGAAMSPDGRWIAYNRMDTPSESSLWIMPAGGGESVRITDGGYLDDTPVWTAAGDRMFFVSTRPARGEAGTFIMALDMDTRTGRPVGDPRQVTLDRLSNRPMPSPDGRLLSYRNGTELKIVPSNGGNARVIADAGRFPSQMAWAPDGESIYFTKRDPAGAVSQILYRVPVEGGAPTEVLRIAERAVTAISPAAGLLAVQDRASARRIELTIRDFLGNVVARTSQPEGTRVIAFSADGRSALVNRMDVGAIMRVRPARGGPARELTDGSVYDWPVGFTADGKALIVNSGDDSRAIAQIVPLDGSAPRHLAPPTEEGWTSWGSTTTHLAYSVPTEDPRLRRLIAVDIATGERTVLSDSLSRRDVIGPGGLYRDVDGELFGTLVDGRVTYRSVAPGRPARVLHTRDLEKSTNQSLAYDGKRVATLTKLGDSIAVVLHPVGGGEPRVLTTLGGPEISATCCAANIAFSWDGQWLALGPLDDHSGKEAIVVRVPDQGRATDVRRIPVGGDYWYEPRWLPDNSGFTVITGRDAHAWVSLVSLDPSQPPLDLTGEDGTPTWGHELSPDGKWIAYPAEVWRGTTLLRMDLPDLKTARR